MAPVQGEVQKRGERRGEGVEKRPPGEAERDAKRAEDNVPLDARTGEPIDPANRGRRPAPSAVRVDRGKQGRGRKPHGRV